MRRGATTPLLRDDGRRREPEQNAVSESASLCHGMLPDDSFEMARGGLQRCSRVVCLTHRVLCGSIGPCGTLPSRRVARQIRAADATVKRAVGGIFVTLNAQLVKLP